MRFVGFKTEQPKSLDHNPRGEVDLGLLNDSLLGDTARVAVIFVSAPALCQPFLWLIGFRMDQQVWAHFWKTFSGLNHEYGAF